MRLLEIAACLRIRKRLLAVAWSSWARKLLRVPHLLTRIVVTVAARAIAIAPIATNELHK